MQSIFSRCANGSVKLRVIVVSAATVISAGQSAQAADFKWGPVDGNIVSQLSIGASWRVEDRDLDLISTGNGGRAASNTTDDGDLNFDKDDNFSTIIKGSHDLELTYRNYGAFFRAKYWYDAALENKDVPHGHEPTSNTPDLELDDSGFNDLAQFSGAELFDAFIYGSFEPSGTPLSVRLGNQVVSWGESTFIQGGINIINPVDVSAFRRPGAEIKEGLLPVPMVYANAGLTENLSLEGFYQFVWEETVLDGCGTYFSTSDFAAEGCDRLAFAANIPDQQNFPAGAFTSRADDREPSDSGQFGLAARYYVDALGMELGAYYLNYHSRLPYISVRKSDDGLPILAGGSPRYFIDYPEDIELFGATFATTLLGWAVSGEISHRLNLPIQINGPELLAASVAGAPTTFLPLLAAAPNGSPVNGFERFDVTQLQVTLIRFFERVLGASRLTVAGEVGATVVHDLPDLSEQRFGRSPVFGTGSLGVGGDDGYVTSNAWGYRVRANLAYTNMFAGVNLTPSIAWAHDVNGFSPAPGQQFQENRKAISIGLRADYLDKYNASISYTNFFGGDFNVIRDRDFVSVTAGISF